VVDGRGLAVEYWTGVLTTFSKIGSVKLFKLGPKWLLMKTAIYWKARARLFAITGKGYVRTFSNIAELPLTMILSARKETDAKA
jgi:hypothetical protein